MATSTSGYTIAPRTSETSEGDTSILLVDDDPGAIQLMGRVLASVGTLRFATNGEDALRMALHCAPDLILLDAGACWASRGRGLRALDLVEAAEGFVFIQAGRQSTVHAAGHCGGAPRSTCIPC